MIKSFKIQNFAREIFEGQQRRHVKRNEMPTATKISSSKRNGKHMKEEFLNDNLKKKRKEKRNIKPKFKPQSSRNFKLFTKLKVILI